MKALKSQNADNLLSLLGLVCGHHGKTLEEGESSYEVERINVACLPPDCGWEGILQRYFQADPFRREMMLLALLFLSDQKEIRRRLGNNLSPLTDPQ